MKVLHFVILSFIALLSVFSPIPSIMNTLTVYLSDRVETMPGAFQSNPNGETNKNDDVYSTNSNELSNKTSETPRNFTRQTIPSILFRKNDYGCKDAPHPNETINEIHLKVPFYGRGTNNIRSLMNVAYLAIYHQVPLSMDINWRRHMDETIDMNFFATKLKCFGSSLRLPPTSLTDKKYYSLNGEESYYYKCDGRTKQWEWADSLMYELARPPQISVTLAENIVKPFRDEGLMIISVHRRGLEGECSRRIVHNILMSGYSNDTVEKYKGTCSYTMEMIINGLNELLPKEMFPLNLTNIALALATDGQDRSGDENLIQAAKGFGMKIINMPNIYTQDTWLMSISDIHFANYASTVDNMVFFFRLRNQRELIYPPLYRYHDRPQPIPVSNIRCNKSEISNG